MPLLAGNVVLLYVMADGFGSDATKIRVPEEGRETAEFKLPEGDHAINGRVIDAKTREPVSGAHVFVTRMVMVDPSCGAEVPNGECVTAEDGSFEIRGLIEGSHMLSVRAEGYVAGPVGQRAQVQLTGDRAVESIDLQLGRPIDIECKFVDAESGEPVEGVEPTLRPS